MDILVIILILGILGAAAIYIYKQKKKGKKCIGCPYGGNCGKCH